jgi:hypothetical protein
LEDFVARPYPRGADTESSTGSDGRTGAASYL